MQGQLLDDQLRELYEKVIKPKHFSTVAKNTATEKTVTFLGGQPGSGKSYLNSIAVDNMPLKDAVVIDSDMLREYHPRKPLIAEKDVYSLDRDCFKWGDMLINDCIKENKNILFDGTFGGSTEQIHQKMILLKERGYKINVSVLAVNDSVSRIGIQYRYEKQIRDRGTGRPVDVNYHDQVYDKIPNNLLETATKGLVDEFMVYGRNHNTHKLRKVTSVMGTDVIDTPGELISAFISERNRPYTEKEIVSLRSWVNATIKLTEENKHDAKSFSAKVNLDRNVKTSDDPIIFYEKETFKVKKTTEILNTKVGSRNVTLTVLSDSDNRQVALISKTDSEGKGRKLTEGMMVTATFNKGDMSVKSKQEIFSRVFQAIDVQLSEPSEITNYNLKLKEHKQSRGLSIS
jgi:predicted ABC-type ATPase